MDSRAWVLMTLAGVLSVPRGPDPPGQLSGERDGKEGEVILGSSLPLLAKAGQSKESLSPPLGCPSPRPTPVTLGLLQGRSSSHS